MGAKFLKHTTLIDSLPTFGGGGGVVSCLPHWVGRMGGTVHTLNYGGGRKRAKAKAPLDLIKLSE